MSDIEEMLAAVKPNVRSITSMRYLFAVVAAAVLAVAANLIWLATSTLRIENAARETISNVAYVACGKTHPIGDLKPAQSVFRLLPACGEDSVEIAIGTALFCQMYVEGEMYHVDARIAAKEAVDCSYDDLLSSLLISKALW